MGCTLSLIGSLIIVLHAPEDKSVDTVDEILEYAMHPGSLSFLVANRLQLNFLAFQVFCFIP